MSAAKANNNKDTYKATAITLIVFGVLYLADKLLHFSTLGLSWVMNRDNFLLYTAIIFLLFKHDKSVGLVDIKLRVDNGFAWHNVGLFVADSVIGRRWYIIFGIYKIK